MLFIAYVLLLSRSRFTRGLKIPFSILFFLCLMLRKSFKFFNEKRILLSVFRSSYLAQRLNLIFRWREFIGGDKLRISYQDFCASRDLTAARRRGVAKVTFPDILFASFVTHACN